MIKGRKRQSLIGQVKTRLLFTAIVFVGLFLTFLIFSTIVASAVYRLEEQKVALHDHINGMLTAMIDQETGLREYIATDDPSLLVPFTNGRPQYLASLQAFRGQTSMSGFSDTTAALAQVASKAETWYTTFAQVQLKNMQSGQLAIARSASTAAAGRALFDQVRAAITQLQQTADRDSLSLQRRNGMFGELAIALFVVVSAFVLVFLRHLFVAFAAALREQLGALEEVTHRLGTGNLTARVRDLAYQELQQLGQTFNRMVEALQQQQRALQERDILEQVLHLNTVLASSPDLHEIATGFLNTALSLLDLHLGALYLSDRERDHLTLLAAQGIPESLLQSEFQLGEGPVGRAASSREPLLLVLPTSDQAERFQVKTVLGMVLPADLYQLPLLVGNELLGVLVVGSVSPMSERTRNVLQAVSSSLSAMLSNARVYQQAQQQAEELARRNHEQAVMNNTLLRQRDELARTNAELEEASRARSQFISTMSHELRTPLTSILGFSQILLRDPGSANLSQRQKDDLGRILKNGRHLLALVNDVLDIAKIESGHLEVTFSQVDLTVLLSSLVDEAQSLAPERQLTLRSQVEEGAETLETDPMKLRQILLNLVSNAVKFTTRGEVTIAATCTTSSDPAVQCIAIAVKDTGIGIPPELHEHIFEAFYQVDEGSTRSFGGTGLGLAIVSRLTTLLGGTIAVESQLGAGSTFTVTLPRQFEERDLGQHPQQAMRLASLPRLLPSPDEPTSVTLDAPVALSAPGHAPRGASRTILAVDDDADILNLLISLLENTPYEVKGVQDPARVLDLAQELQPCAITLDVMMPHRNGWQILYQLKTTPATAHIPVIMLTILAEQTTGYVLGADEYLIKPFERAALLETLNRLVESRSPVPLEAGQATGKKVLSTYREN